MKPVICFGEALIDFLNTGEQQDGQLVLSDYRQYPGGAPANAAVSVAKLGGQAYFAGQVGADLFGDFLKTSLEQYEVDTSYLLQHPTAKTALAFVKLDETGDRSFSFYRHQTADVMFKPEQVSDGWFNKPSIFHFCSNTLTESGITEATKEAVTSARENNTIISFDVNLRHNLWASGNADKDIVNEFVFLSDLLKFSKDEIDYLSDNNQAEYIDKCLANGVSLVVVTDGANQIEYFTNHESNRFDAPSVKAVDTTAGGDAFIGSLLFGLSKEDDFALLLGNKSRLKALLKFASYCGAHAVTLPGAFPALPSFQDIKIHWEQFANSGHAVITE